MRSYASLPNAFLVETFACQVNAKSADVIGEPSSHTAASLIRNRTVNGSWVSPPFSRVGASTSIGEATKLPATSSCMARGSTCSRTVYQAHSDALQLVMGLMHSGHCSAPKTGLPPIGHP